VTKLVSGILARGFGSSVYGPVPRTPEEGGALRRAKLHTSELKCSIFAIS